MTPKEFFMNNLDYDKKFLDTIMETYKKEMISLANGFFQTNENYITRPALSIPNEVQDYLDHNGFTIEFEGSDIIVRRLHPKKYVSGGWVEYTPPATAPKIDPVVTWEELKEIFDKVDTKAYAYPMTATTTYTNSAPTWTTSSTTIYSDCSDLLYKQITGTDTYVTGGK